MMVRAPKEDLHGPKPVLPPPSGKDQKKPTHQALPMITRSFRLFLLIIYAATAILMLASRPSSFDSLLPSVFSRRNQDLDSLRTHVAIKPSPLHAHRESMLSSQTVCQALIDGKYKADTAGGRGDGAGVLCCDRSHHRTDVCYMRGDIRTEPQSSSVLLYNSSAAGRRRPPQRIRPYTRKWEAALMATVDELTLVPTRQMGPAQSEMGGCDVRHDEPAVVLSTGGYTGNVYHEFNDGIIPLYLTAERFKGEVVLVVLEYHPWWYTKYVPVVEKLSKHKLVDFRRDRRVHCFPEMIVGMRIHGELSVDPKLMPTGKSIRDFQALLLESFGAGRAEAPPLPLPLAAGKRWKPKITILVRRSSRVLLNLRSILRRCKSLGFQTQMLNPKYTTPLSDIHEALSTTDVMLAVHGAALTHFLFAPPGAVLIQVVPLGLDWAADEYYGQPARKLGLEYMEYKVVPGESSLSSEYGPKDPVIADPIAVTSRGWQETKRIYLEHQNVTLDLRRFGKVLAGAYSHVRGARRVRLHAPVNGS